MPKTSSTSKQSDLQETKPSLSHDELLKGLYFVFDLFSRSNTPFFLLGDTAKAVIENKSLSGDKVEVGVRKVEYQDRPFGIMQAFHQAESFTDNEILYKIDNIPVVVKVIDSLDPMFMATNTVMYQHEFFNIPNPFKEYWEKRHLF